MKNHHLLTGVAIAAALAFSAPLGAQPANPSGGNAMGMPGPNPGGPGLTPYNSGPNPGGATLSGPRTAPPAAMAPSAPPPSMSETSATPPSHRHARHTAHAKASHHPSRFPNLQGNSVANELNQAELARLQSGNFTAPPPPPGPDMSSPQPDQGAARPAGRMPAGGRSTSAPTTGR